MSPSGATIDESRAPILPNLGLSPAEFRCLDAYFDRKPRSHSAGFKAADVKKAEAVFVSHAHFDHISDIEPVAKQTGAKVVGAPITSEVAQKLGVPASQIVTAKGGESLKFGDATLEVALAQHSTIQDGLQAIYAQLYANDTRPNTDQEKSITAFVQSRGSFDPKIFEPAPMPTGSSGG